MAATCEACGAEIVWARNTSTGRPAPIDAQPSDTGNAVLARGAGPDEYVYRVLSHEDLANGVGAGHRHTSHFATCPESASFRRRRANRQPAP